MIQVQNRKKKSVLIGVLQLYQLNVNIQEETKWYCKWFLNCANSGFLQGLFSLGIPVVFIILNYKF